MAFGKALLVRSRMIPLMIVLMWTLFQILSTQGWRVSRRMANPMYVLVSTALNLTCIYLCQWFFGSTVRSNAADLAIETINKHSLPIFLLANVQTGLINLSIKTLDISASSAFALLLCHMVTIASIARQVL